MAKYTKVNIDPTQKGIKSFFSVTKEPLRIESKSVLTTAENNQLLRSYRARNRKSRKKVIKSENSEDDVEYIKTETPEDTTRDSNFCSPEIILNIGTSYVHYGSMHENNLIENISQSNIKTEMQEDTITYRCNINPCSPEIVFDTGTGYVHYGSMHESNLIENISCNSMCEISPSKRRRKEADSLKQLTITKSKISEVPKKVSRTLQMTQTSDQIRDDTLNESPLLKGENLLDNENINSFLEVSLEENESMENVLLEQNENLEENGNNSGKITNHVLLVDDILSDILTSHLSTLLFDDEINLLKTFQSLPVKHKYLSCKLFTHQIKWHNAYKFAESIKLPVGLFEMKQMIVCLKENLIIKSDYSSESTVYLLNQLGADDVKAIHDTLRLKSKQKKKPLLIDSILSYINSQTTLHPTISLDERVRKMIFNKLGDVIQINPPFYTAFYKAHLLYMYTNPEFDIPSGLYHRMYNIRSGSISHPAYICQDDVIFQNAQEFADFYKAFSYKSEVLETLTKKKGEAKFNALFDLSGEIVKEFNNILDNKNQTVIEDKPGHLKRFTAGHQYASTLWILCNHLGAKYPSEVEEWLVKLLKQTSFYQRRRGIWYSHLSLIYKAHLKEFNKAIDTLLNGIRDKDISPVDLAEIVYRARSYTSKKRYKSDDLINELEIMEGSIPYSESFPSIHIRALGNDLTTGDQRGDYKYMYPNGDISYMNVEQIAIRHYNDKEGFTNGIHCEGALVQTIFYILFWDIIFTDGIPYTFVCKMQYLPLDFFTEEFYEKRKAIIEQRLFNIKSSWPLENLSSYIDNTWRDMFMHKSLFMVDHIKDSIMLYKIITCIGRSVVSDICRRLVGNFRDYRAGMPDLFVYTEDKCKFVEVKGPGDKLSTKQKLWINYLLSIGADAEVCYVSKIGSGKGKKKKIL